MRSLALVLAFTLSLPALAQESSGGLEKTAASQKASAAPITRKHVKTADIRRIELRSGSSLSFVAGDIPYHVSLSINGNDPTSQRILALNSFLSEMRRADHVTLPFNPEATTQSVSTREITFHFDTLK